MLLYKIGWGEEQLKEKLVYWRSGEGLTLIRGWARDGLTKEQIAENLGVCIKTLTQWQEKYEEIGGALKKTKAIVDYEIEEALYKSALSGGTSAQKWLEHRRPAQWGKAESAGADLSQDDNLFEAIKKAVEAGETDAL